MKKINMIGQGVLERALYRVLESVRARGFHVTVKARAPNSLGQRYKTFTTKKEMEKWLGVAKKNGVTAVTIENVYTEDTFDLRVADDGWLGKFLDQTAEWPFAYIKRDDINMDDLMEEFDEAALTKRGLIASIPAVRQQFKHYDAPISMEDAFDIMGINVTTSTWDAAYARLKKVLGDDFIITFDGAEPTIVPAQGKTDVDIKEKIKALVREELSEALPALSRPRSETGSVRLLLRAAEVETLRVLLANALAHPDELSSEEQGDVRSLFAKLSKLVPRVRSRKRVARRQYRS